MPSSHSVSKIWLVLQAVVWVLCLSMIVLLFVKPEIGLHAFWDVLIPVAPALVALLPGVWRNICPTATMSQLPRRFKYSKKKKLSAFWGYATYVWMVLAIIRVIGEFFR